MSSHDWKLPEEGRFKERLRESKCCSAESFLRYVQRNIVEETEDKLVSLKQIIGCVKPGDGWVKDQEESNRALRVAREILVSPGEIPCIELVSFRGVYFARERSRLLVAALKGLLFPRDRMLRAKVRKFPNVAVGQNVNGVLRLKSGKIHFTNVSHLAESVFTLIRRMSKGLWYGPILNIRTEACRPQVTELYGAPISSIEWRISDALGPHVFADNLLQSNEIWNLVKA